MAIWGVHCNISFSASGSVEMRNNNWSSFPLTGIIFFSIVLQGVMGALYFGVGKALGSLVGGLAIEELGVRNTFR